MVNRGGEYALSFFVILYVAQLTKKGGMKNGDIIVGINGKPVTNIQDYMFRLNQLKAGDIISVSVIRNGTPVELIINL